MKITVALDANDRTYLEAGLSELVDIQARLIVRKRAYAKHNAHIPLFSERMEREVAEHEAKISELASLIERVTL